MSTAGNERGLSLRSPGRFCAAADRLVDLYADAPDPALSTAVVDAWVRAEAYRLYTWGTVTAARRRRRHRRGRLGEQGVLVRAGRGPARDRARPARPEGRGRLAPGRTATCSPCPARSTRAPTRSSATSSPSASSACPESHAGMERSRLTARAAGLRRLSRALLAAPTRSSVGRAWAAGDHDPGLALWRRLADLGVNSLLVPRTTAAWGPRRWSSCVAFEALGRHAVPGPWIESAAYLPSRCRRGSSERRATVAVPPHTPYAAGRRCRRARPTSSDGRAATGRSRRQVSSVDPIPAPVRGRRPGRRSDVTATSTQAFDLATLRDVRTAARRRRTGAGRRSRVREAAHAVRPDDRFLPGDQAPAGERPHRARLRPAAGLRRGGGPDRSHGLGREDPERGRGQPRGPRRPAGPRCDRLHPGVRPEPWLLRIRALQSAWGTPAFHRERLLADLLATRDHHD